MPIQKFTVSRDDSVYEAWPDVILTNGGKLICVFTECTHHGDRENSRLMLTESCDRGRTWSAKKPLTAFTPKDHFFNCARISKLNDGSLAIVCDRILQEENRASEIYIWRSDAEGTDWGEPEIIPFCAIVPDRLLQLKSGRLILGGQFKSRKTEKLEQFLIYSDDDGKHGRSLLRSRPTPDTTCARCLLLSVTTERWWPLCVKIPFLATTA